MIFPHTRSLAMSKQELRFFQPMVLDVCTGKHLLNRPRAHEIRIHLPLGIHKSWIYSVCSGHYMTTHGHAIGKNGKSEKGVCLLIGKSDPLEKWVNESEDKYRLL